MNLLIDKTAPRVGGVDLKLWEWWGKREIVLLVLVREKLKSSSIELRFVSFWKKSKDIKELKINYIHIDVWPFSRDLCTDLCAFRHKIKIFAAFFLGFTRFFLRIFVWPKICADPFLPKFLRGSVSFIVEVLLSYP